MTEDWTKEWERRIVNGTYPLRRFLGRSDHSVVFLTECKTPTAAQAAIKIMPAYPSLAEAQLSHWRRVATLSHPHLIRLLEAGRCQLGGHDFLFVVMDYAEQNLAQILPSRALTPEEVRDILPPSLDALAYLHGKNLVQGSLKPTNFLVVNDQLKLASDTIRPAGEGPAIVAKLSLYEPPESKGGRISTAGDIWGFGITLVEALTRSPPGWSRDTSAPVVLPASLPPEFVDAVRRCLSRDPGHRATIAELAALFKVAPATPPESHAPSLVSEPLVRTLSTPLSAKTRSLVTAIALGVMTLWAVWVGVHSFHSHSTAAPIAVMPPPTEPIVSIPTAVETPKASTAELPAILHQAMPDISPTARASIRGIIKVAVRVTIDRSGNVAAAMLGHRGSSKYFARAAMEAAKKWKFSPAADQASRVWLLEFEFTRAGTAVHAAAIRS